MRSKAPAAILTAFSTLCACAAGPHGAKPEAAPQPSPTESTDFSYDWHVLLAAPFGSALKAIPFKLHEVVFFRDEALTEVPADEPECYAPDLPAPRFLGQAPREYLMCFREDRLARIQASVAIDSLDATQVFQAACIIWLKNAVDVGASAASVPPNAGACEGRDALVHFRARLGEDADGAQLPISIVLDVVPERL